MNWKCMSQCFYKAVYLFINLTIMYHYLLIGWTKHVALLKLILITGKLFFILVNVWRFVWMLYHVCKNIYMNAYAWKQSYKFVPLLPLYCWKNWYVYVCSVHACVCVCVCVYARECVDECTFIHWASKETSLLQSDTNQNPLHKNKIISGHI